MIDQPNIPFTDLVKLDVRIRVNWKKTYNAVIKMLYEKFPEYSNDEDSINIVTDKIMLDLVKHIAEGDEIMKKRNGGAEAMYIAQKVVQWEKDGLIKFQDEDV